MTNRKPAWWQLYLLAPIMLVLLGIEHFDPVPRVSVDLVVAGIVVSVFVGMLVWVHLNGGLLEWYEIENDPSYYDFKVATYDPASRAKREGNGVRDEGRPEDKTVFSAMPPLPYVKTRQSIQLKEEEKWFLN